MKILIINPNTCDGFTEAARNSARSCKADSTEIVAVSSPIGPESIEGYFDEMVTTMGVLEVIAQEKDNYDAFIVACFSNHCSTYAARQLTDKPVIGIFEAPLMLASQLGAKFSIVSTSDRWKPLLEAHVKDVGLSKHCASVRMTGLDVIELDKKGPDEIAVLLYQTSLLALEQDGAEVIVLGCCGMSGLDKTLSAQLHVPVIDPVTAALKMAESLVSLGLKTSKRLTYSPVLPRETVGVSPTIKKIYQ